MLFCLKRYCFDFYRNEYMLLFRQAKFTFDHVAGVLLKGKSKSASKKTKNIFHLFKSDRTNYTTLWPKYRLRKAMGTWGGD